MNVSRHLSSFPVVVAAFVALSTVFPEVALSEPKSVSGKITDVTLYQGQALVTRTIPIDAAQGALEIVVTDLPENVVSDSLFAEGGPTVQVRAVRYRSRAVGEEPREEVRTLEEAIDTVREELDVNSKNRGLLGKKVRYLDKLEGFVAPAADVELSRGVLNAEALEKITLFSFKQRQEIVSKEIELTREAKAINEKLSLLQRQRAELASKSSRTVREAVLFLDKAAGGKESVRLNYLVNNCGWSPSYVFRAGAEAKEIRVEYNALVHQMTGEDWDGVRLALSTASPALSAAGPGIAPFYVALTPDGEQREQEEVDVISQLQSIRRRQVAALIQNRKALSNEDNFGSSWAANTAANDFQRMELLGDRDILSSIRLEDSDTEEGPSISYPLDGTTSLASRADQQVVRIVEASLKSRFYHVATPVLSSYVYREAELTNTSKQDLLGGPLTAYLDGRFVGRGEILTVARGQMFMVGFGADPRLRARRELLSKTEDVQGGNREITIRSALFLENYRDTVANVRVLERLPYSNRGDDIRVALKETTEPLSEDKLYQRQERPKGILRWDIQVPAQSTKEAARSIEYNYTLEFDRNFQLAAPRSAPRLEQEFQKLQKARFLH